MGVANFLVCFYEYERYFSKLDESFDEHKKLFFSEYELLLKEDYENINLVKKYNINQYYTLIEGILNSPKINITDDFYLLNKKIKDLVDLDDFLKNTDTNKLIENAIINCLYDYVDFKDIEKIGFNDKISNLYKMIFNTLGYNFEIEGDVLPIENIQDVEKIAGFFDNSDEEIKSKSKLIINDLISYYEKNKILDNLSLDDKKKKRKRKI